MTDLTITQEGAGSLTIQTVAAADTIEVGAKGPQGLAGNSAGFKFQFNNQTTDTTANPGTGYITYNNAAVASVTRVAISDRTADVGNPDIQSYIDTWDLTASAVKGYLLLQSRATPQNWVLFQVTALTDRTTHTELTVTTQVQSGTFGNNDTLTISYSATPVVPVDSVFGRTGAVVAAAGDYDSSEVSASASATNYTPSGATVEGHLEGVDSELAAVYAQIAALVAADIAAAASATNYTPAASTVEGHLSGIDSEFGDVYADIAALDDANIAAAGTATNYTPGSATVDGHLTGIDTELGDVYADIAALDDANIAAAGSATNYTPAAATVEGHLAGIDTELGDIYADIAALDDDNISAAASATNYTPAASTVAGHLSGIDTALASAGGGTPYTVQRYTAGTSTWTKPANLAFIKITMVAGGGGGGGVIACTTGNAIAGSGAGGGAGYIGYIPAASLGATENYTVGVGGASSTIGSATKFGGLTLTEIVCAGGPPGGGYGALSAATQAAGGANGGQVTATAGVGIEIPIPGGPGGMALRVGGTEATSGTGGSSILGSGGSGIRVFSSNTNGNAGAGYGGGGGGAASANQNVAARSGGSGADGVIIIEEHYL